MTREEKQKAIDALKISAPVTAVTQEEFNDYIHILNQVMDWLEQEPKTGHWIIIDDCEKFIAKCSECGQIEDSRMIGKYAYCHCGAKMVEPQEGRNEWKHILKIIDLLLTKYVSHIRNVVKSVLHTNFAIHRQKVRIRHITWRRIVND